MGTSQSSRGAPSNVPLVPSWVPDTSSNDNTSNEPLSSNNSSSENDTDTTWQEELDNELLQQIKDSHKAEEQLAPRGRFGSARKNISDYAQTGNRESFSRGMKSYSSKGMSGSRNAVRRFGATSKSANSLYQALSALASQQVGNEKLDKLDKNVLARMPKDEVINYIVEALSPTDGTQDGEARKYSMNNALSELLTEFPDADICNLNEDQIDFTVEHFVIEDVVRRFDLDLGQSIIENAPSAVEGAMRFKEAQDFIRQVVQDAFKTLKESGEKMSSENVSSVANKAIEMTFDVFSIEALV